MGTAVCGLLVGAFLFGRMKIAENRWSLEVAEQGELELMLDVQRIVRGLAIPSEYLMTPTDLTEDQELQRINVWRGRGFERYHESVPLADLADRVIDPHVPPERQNFAHIDFEALGTEIPDGGEPPAWEARTLWHNHAMKAISSVQRAYADDTPTPSPLSAYLRSRDDLRDRVMRPMLMRILRQSSDRRLALFAARALFVAGDRSEAYRSSVTELVADFHSIEWFPSSLTEFEAELRAEGFHIPLPLEPRLQIGADPGGMPKYVLRTFGGTGIPDHGDGLGFVDDRQILVDGATGIEVWDVATGVWQRSIGKLRTATFQRGCNRVAGLLGESVMIMDARSGERIRELPFDAKRRQHGSRLALSPDGERVALATGDRWLYVWKIADGSELVRFEPGAEQWNVGKVERLAFSPDGSMLAVQAGRNQLHLIDSASGQRLHAPLESSSTFECAFHPQSGELFYVPWDRDGKFNVLDVRTGQVVRDVPCHAGRHFSSPLHFSADGTKIAYAVEEGALVFCDAETGAQLPDVTQRERFKRRSFAFSSDFRWIAGRKNESGSFGLFSTATMIARDGDSDAGDALVFDAAVSSFGFRLVKDDGLEVWDLRSGELAHKIDVRDRYQPLLTFALSPTGNLVAVGDAREASIHRTSDGRELRRFTCKGQPLLLSEKGNYLLTNVRMADDHGPDIALVDTESGKVRYQRSTDAKAFAFSPDSEHWVVGSGSGTFWDFGDRKASAGKRLDVDRPHHLAVPPRIVGNAVFVPSDAKVEVFTLPDGAWSQSIKLPRRYGTLAVSKDGSMLAYTDKRSVFVFEVKQGIEIAQIRVDPNPPETLAFTDDGQLVTAFSSGRSVVWDTDANRKAALP